FIKLLKQELDKGQNIELVIKGYASPLAKTDYNVNLALRRISSMINYIEGFGYGQFEKYIEGTADNGGKLSFVKKPFGEYAAKDFVSDNLNDKRNSVYSRAAALERKIEIVSINQADNDSSYSSISFNNEVKDFGEVKQGEKLTHKFSFINAGNEDLKITNIKTSCGCTVAKYPKEKIKPSQKEAIKVTFNTEGKSGKQVKTVFVETNGVPRRRELTITAEVE
ncbi:MAG: DUF1573 domain-containing protein, partial [Flavobacteriales bacterium]